MPGSDARWPICRKACEICDIILNLQVEFLGPVISLFYIHSEFSLMIWKYEARQLINVNAKPN